MFGQSRGSVSALLGAGQNNPLHFYQPRRNDIAMADLLAVGLLAVGFDIFVS